MLVFVEKRGTKKISVNPTSRQLAMMTRLCFSLPHLVQLASCFKEAAGSCSAAAPYCTGWRKTLQAIQIKMRLRV